MKEGRMSESKQEMTLEEKKKAANQEYIKACQEMGHLQFNLEKITKRMEDLRASVLELESLVERLNKQGN